MIATGESFVFSGSRKNCLIGHSLTLITYCPSLESEVRKRHGIPGMPTFRSVYLEEFHLTGEIKPVQPAKRDPQLHGLCLISGFEAVTDADFEAPHDLGDRTHLDQLSLAVILIHDGRYVCRARFVLLCPVGCDLKRGILRHVLRNLLFLAEVGLAVALDRHIDREGRG